MLRAGRGGAVVIAVAVASAAAAAGPRVRLELQPGLPFGEADLAAEVALRIDVAEGEAAGEPVAQVAPAGEGWVSVRIGDKERTVGVGTRKGEAAARRVALALVDLALAEANPEAGAARRRAPPAAPPIARPIEVPPFTGRLVVRLAPVVGVGTNGDQVHAGGALAASIKIVRWLRAFLEVQAGGGPSAQVGPVSVALAEVPLRLGLGARVWRLIEVRAALVVEPYRLAADGAPSESGALVGGGVSAEGYVPLARRVALAIGVGADLLANRLAWTVGGQPALATERAQFWIGVGVAAEALQ